MAEEIPNNRSKIKSAYREDAAKAAWDEYQPLALAAIEAARKAEEARQKFITAFGGE